MPIARRGFVLKTCIAHLAVLIALSSAPGLAQEGSEHGDQVWIPMSTKSFFRGEVTIKLEATLYRPKGSGPFPLVIYSHTSTGAGKIAASNTMRPERLAAFFVERGIAVLAPMRRGRGASEGSYDEPYHCNHGAHSSGLDNAIEDTDAAIAYAKTLPLVDPERIVLAARTSKLFCAAPA